MSATIIKCLPRSDDPEMMRFWCPFCKMWHFHGKGNGFRTLHCTNPDSPLKDSHYKIKMMTKGELRNIRRAIDEYLEG